MIISNERYEVQELTKSMFEVKMVLIIRKFQRSDVGSYHCIAKNSLGDVDSVVKLHGNTSLPLFLVLALCLLVTNGMLACTLSLEPIFQRVIQQRKCNQQLLAP